MNYELLRNAYYRNKEEYETSYDLRFNSLSTIHTELTVHLSPAFIVVTPEIMLLEEKIIKLSKDIALLCERLPEECVKHYSYHLLVEELHLTNEIEGVYSTRREFVEAIAAVEKKGSPKRFASLLRKYVMILNKRNIPLLTCEDIRKLYDEAILVEVMREDKKNAPDGLIFRKESVDVTTSTQRVIHRGVFPESKIISDMTIALSFLNDEHIPILIRIAAFHYMFGYIHPFYDGNGRINRLITSYLLSRELTLPVGMSLSCAIKRETGRYYKPFDNTNDEKSKGDMTGYITCFFELLLDAATEQKRALTERSEKYAFFLERLKAFGNMSYSELLKPLLDASLFGIRGVSVEELSARTKKAPSTVRNLLRALLGDTKLIRAEKMGQYKLYDLDLNILSELPE